MYSRQNENAFWALLGCTMADLFEWNQHIAVPNIYIKVPEDVANKIKMIVGPHGRTMIKAMQVNNAICST